jgi:uncharacterized repeat protein (TIGR01451 family)
MRLGEILNKIFRKRHQPTIEEREMAEDIYRPLDEHRPDEQSHFKEVEKHILTEQTKKKESWWEWKHGENINIALVVSVLAVIVFISLLTVFFVRLKNSAFKEENVKISLNGPEIVAVGEEVYYEVDIDNKNRVDLDDSVLHLELPNNFVLLPNDLVVDRNLSGAKIIVGKIKKHNKKHYKIGVRVNYTNDQQMFLKAKVVYKPSNISSYFQADVVKNIKIKKRNLSIYVSTSETVSSGETVVMDVIVKNDDQDDFQNMILKIDYPEGFVYENSSLNLLEGRKNEWLIDNLSAGDQKKITVTGKITGQLDEIKKFGIFLLKEGEGETIFSKAEKTLRIVPQKVLLRQVVDTQNVSPGDYLQYTIFFKNNSTTPLRNLILKSYLPGKYIDRSSVDTKYGYYDSRENVITWKAADLDKLKLLEPGEEGRVDFRVRLQDRIIPGSKKDKNIYTLAHSEIESLDVDSPIFENKRVVSSELKVPINSVAGINVKAVYVPEAENEKGVLKVDKKALFKIQFNVYNTTSQLKGVELLADLPSGTGWERQIYPEGDNLKFDGNSNKLKWNLGVVDMGTGFISPAEKAEFLVSVTPSVNQVGHSIDLLKNISIQAKDMFTGNNIGYYLKAINSEGVEGLQDGIVVAD